MPPKKLDGWDRFEAAIEAGLTRIYVYGHPGLGKTYTAKQMLEAKTPVPCYDVSFNEDAVSQEFVGHYIPHGTTFEWHDGPLVRALKGGTIVMNEIPRASFAVKDMLLSILDTHDSISLTLPSGDVIKPHVHFRIIATGNVPPDAAGLDDALIDRFQAIIPVGEPHPMLVKRLNDAAPHMGDLLHDSYTKTDASVQHLSPRKLLAITQLMRDRVDVSSACRMVLGNSEGTTIAALYLSLQTGKR